jgi:catechol 2,3-dioxygenase-like lactoylglutathione lyase family enzyme
MGHALNGNAPHDLGVAGMRVRDWKIALVLLVLPLTQALAEPAADPPTAANIGASMMIGPALRSTDLDRSIKFYTEGLGMVVATKLAHGPVTEVMLGFDGNRQPPIILLYKDETPGKSPAIEQGNGFGRIMLRTPNASALAARLAALGYPVGEMHADTVNHMKVFWAEDPDGYRYEITERTAPKN